MTKTKEKQKFIYFDLLWCNKRMNWTTNSMFDALKSLACDMWWVTDCMYAICSAFHQKKYQKISVLTVVTRTHFRCVLNVTICHLQKPKNENKIIQINMLCNKCTQSIQTIHIYANVNRKIERKNHQLIYKHSIVKFQFRPTEDSIQ